jgi:hypothetical protein
MDYQGFFVGLTGNVCSLRKRPFLARFVLARSDATLADSRSSRAEEKPVAASTGREAPNAGFLAQPL